jgi:hypothetical protein
MMKDETNYVQSEIGMATDQTNNGCKRDKHSPDNQQLAVER